MTKKEICLENKTFAYYSGFGGIEFKHIEYGIEDYMYCVSGTFNGKHSYHKLKIYYEDNGTYLKLNGYKILFDECIRV